MDIFDRKTKNRYENKKRKNVHKSSINKSESFDKLSDRLINKLCKNNFNTRETLAMKNTMKYFAKQECDKVISHLSENNTIHEDVSNIFKHLIIKKIYDNIEEDSSAIDQSTMKDMSVFIGQHISSLFDLKDIIQLFALSIIGNNLPNIHDFMPHFASEIETLISQRMTTYCETNLIDKDIIDKQIIQVVMNHYLYLFDEYMINKIYDPIFLENMQELIDASIVNNFGEESEVNP